MITELRRVGDRAIMVDCHSGAVARYLAECLRTEPLPAQRELVPGAKTLMIDFSRAMPLDIVRERISALPDSFEHRVDNARRLSLDVVYDGEDLAEVAQIMGMSVERLITTHTGTRWRAAFAGFLPGFFYLEAVDAVFDVPRRSEPRVRVPASSVAVAGGYSGVYPAESPGGWHLLGRSDAILWDPSRATPSLMNAGDEIAFRAVRELVHIPATAPLAAPPERPADAMVTASGLLTVVQDLGRPGYAGYGVPPSGAADRLSFIDANLLVGNPPDAAGLEIIAPGFSLVAKRDLVLALTGAPAPASLTGASEQNEVAHGTPFLLCAGDELSLGAPERGLRSYLSFRGGLCCEETFGSSASDMLSGLGPDPVTAGSVLTVGAPPSDAVSMTATPARIDVSRPFTVVRGPRDSFFDESAFVSLFEDEWTVSNDSNRVGIRLRGERPLTTSIDSSLPSEAVRRGSIQVPPSGQPIIFLADHPVTGGYPVIATLTRDETSRLAQARPGDVLRFRDAGSDL